MTGTKLPLRDNTVAINDTLRLISRLYLICCYWMNQLSSTSNQRNRSETISCFDQQCFSTVLRVLSLDYEIHIQFRILDQEVCLETRPQMSMKVVAMTNVQLWAYIRHDLRQ